MTTPPLVPDGISHVLLYGEPGTGKSHCLQLAVRPAKVVRVGVMVMEATGVTEE